MGIRLGVDFFLVQGHETDAMLNRRVGAFSMAVNATACARIIAERIVFIMIQLGRQAGPLTPNLDQFRAALKTLGVSGRRDRTLSKQVKCTRSSSNRIESLDLFMMTHDGRKEVRKRL